MDPQAQWMTADYAAGDVVVFSMKTAHMSTSNTTAETLRLSADVRWQPASDVIDERYVGTEAEMAVKQAQRKRGGAWAAGEAPAGVVTMKDLRERWGV